MLFLIPARFVSRRFNESSTKETRHNITASQVMVHGLGLVIGPLIGGSALDEYGPATAFYVVAFAAVGTAIGYTFLPETLAEDERSTDEDLFGGIGSSSSSSSSSFLKFLNFKNMMTNNNKKSNLGKLLKDPDQRLLQTCVYSSVLVQRI